MKKIMFAFPVLLSILSLFSCQGGKEAGARNEKITLSVYCSKDGWRDIFLTVAKKIEEDHGIAIDLVTLPNEQIEPV
ncbi:MAG: hypothetical protein LBG42_00800, partial [Treponema sp.]|nr:hypothetical protein [Treponema sp.]